MTTRTRIILTALTALLVGAVVGGIASGYVVSKFTTVFFVDGWMLGKAVEVQTKVAVLQNIRDSQTEKATKLLETMLDADIMSLSTSIEYAEGTNLAVSRAIQKAKGYRSQYPRHTTSKEVDDFVNGVLKKAPSNESNHP
jgi:hypothetical protein